MLMLFINLYTNVCFDITLVFQKYYSHAVTATGF